MALGRVLIPLFALALAGCLQKDNPSDDMLVAPSYAVKTAEEEAALAILRMGMDRWVVACAFAHAKDGQSLDEAEKNCTIGLNLNQRKDAA